MESHAKAAAVIHPQLARAIIENLDDGGRTRFPTKIANHSIAPGILR